LRFLWPKVPGKQAEVRAIQNLRDAESVLGGHYLVVGVDVGEIFPLRISIPLEVLGCITNLEFDAVKPVRAEVSFEAVDASPPLELRAHNLNVIFRVNAPLVGFPASLSVSQQILAVALLLSF
jgi:hypothetical protein